MTHYFARSLVKDKRSYRMAKRTVLFLVAALLLFILIAFDIRAIPSVNRIYNSLLIKTDSSTHFEFSSTSLNIAIIGSSGYIGSRLLHYLQQKENWNVVGYDRVFSGQASHEILTEDLQKFQAVVYLGGLIDRKRCQDHPNVAERENVKDIYNLAKRMLPSQLLIFASTSEIAEGYSLIPMDETSPVQTHLFDAYVASMRRREITLQKLSSESSSAPRMIGLRFGIVVGLSHSQRIDFGHMAYVCQAFLGGRLHIVHPEAHRSFLSMEDLLQAVTVVIQRQQSAKQFDLFHLQSFSASISNMANAIALRSGAHVFLSNYSLNESNHGFSLNTSKFRTTYRFAFTENQDEIISKLIDDVPRLCVGRQSSLDKDSVPCVVCGSREMHLILDLHDQPLANDFRKQPNEAKKCKRFPLRLVRCPKCHHSQLSYIVDRAYLFSHYLYQSGTSKSIEIYFKWLAEKIIDESMKTNGTVLEIASNDGSQLTEFAKLGWKTVGVDPAKNLAELARAKGHTVYVGFWGVDTFPDLPSPNSLDAIVAQNVLAHVGNPVQFLRACAAVMGTRTKLYIQTSQCEMYETGQFDTVYHEHVSFFTAHSFKKIATLVGLHIVNFEITPIHGRSCLVTFQRVRSPSATFLTTFHKTLASSFSLALQNERNLGLTDDWFYVKYQAQAYSMRQWIVRQLAHLYAEGHVIIGYGAAAKGMVLLHSLLAMQDETWQFSYVIDDAPLKQNTYCPGTSIPVRPSSELSNHDLTKPLTIVVFAWNFVEEISDKIRTKTFEKGIKNVFAIVPFPQQQLIKINSNSSTIVTQNAFKLLSWPFPFPSMRRPVILFSHLIKEEILLSSWIRHHAPMFDMAILTDYDITNKSSQIVRNEAPSTWKIISPSNKEVSPQMIDEQIKSYEKLYPKAWKIVLTTDELLVHPNLRQMLAETEHTGNVMALRFRSLMMVGSDSVPSEGLTSLLNQRTRYISNSFVEEKHDSFTSGYRYIHRCTYTGHIDEQRSIRESVWRWTPVGFIADYRYTFLVQHTKDKLSILENKVSDGRTINEDVQHSFDITHLKQLKENLKTIQIDDLQNVDASNDELKMAHRLWREMTNH
jgi:nucleoside-diphosphate-sugar epimerase